jgi:hypothetical protein
LHRRDRILADGDEGEVTEPVAAVDVPAARLDLDQRRDVRMTANDEAECGIGGKLLP